MRSSSGCCPGLGKPLGFQPVFACVSKSLNKNPYQNAQQYVALQEGFLGDRLTARNLKQNLKKNL